MILPVVLPITLTIAAAAAVLHVWLSLRVSRLRRPLRIGLGDGGNETLLQRMRAHGNFAENMPIFLILFALIELAGGDRTILWALGIVFIAARLLHAFGMDRPGANWLRVSGISINWLVILGLAGWALSFAYRDASANRGIQISPGRTAEAAPVPPSSAILPA